MVFRAVRERESKRVNNKKNIYITHTHTGSVCVVYCHGTKRREEFSSQRVVGGVAAQRGERAHPVALAAGSVGSNPGLFPELGRGDGLEDGFQLDVRFLERGDRRLEFMHTRTHTRFEQRRDFAHVRNGRKASEAKCSRVYTPHKQSSVSRVDLGSGDASSRTCLAGLSAL